MRVHFERLERADAAIEATGAGTLAPDRSRATRLVVLAERVVDETRARPDTEAVLDGLASIADAQRRSFPDNLLFDYDYLAASMTGHVRRRGRSWIDDAVPRLVGLYELFGRDTPIRFRYTHDFVYGWDWAKWVRREPEARAATGPFDFAFLRAMDARGHELLSLIEPDDQEYHRLRDEGPRNPFPFSREPASELALHRDLARRGLVPVEAWRWDARPRWDRPFADLRVQRARALGLTRASFNPP